MPESPQDADQIYNEGTAEGYGGFVECDANVYGWAKRVLDRNMLEKRTVLDAGCGKGAMFKHFEAVGATRIIGVEASAQMVNGIPASDHQAIVKWPASKDYVQRVLALSRHLIIQGPLQEVLQEAGIQAAVAASIFNVVCFSHPREPIESMAHGVLPGGRLVMVTNAFVPSGLSLDAQCPNAAVDIDLHDPVLHRETLAPGTVFQQVLHLQNDDGLPFDLPLQDHAHPIDSFIPPLSDAWELETVQLFPPQGCTLVDPQAPGKYEGAHRHFGNHHPVFSPLANKRMQYAKLCLVARRRE